MDLIQSVKHNPVYLMPLCNKPQTLSIGFDGNINSFLRSVEMSIQGDQCSSGNAERLSITVLGSCLDVIDGLQ